MSRDEIKRRLVEILSVKPVKTNVLSDSHFIEDEHWEIFLKDGNIIWKRSTDHECVTLRWDELCDMEISMLLDALWSDGIIDFDGTMLDS